MTVRAMMFCSTVESDANHGQRVKLYTQYDQTIPEEKRFAEASPSGAFEVYIKNPVVQGFFVPGKKYYFDVTLKEEPIVQPS